jgi:hypothetical protein
MQFFFAGLLVDGLREITPDAISKPNDVPESAGPQDSNPSRGAA